MPRRIVYPDEEPHMDQETALKLMRASGLTVRYLANMLGVDHPRISRWMNGSRKMPKTAILLLEKQFQLGEIRVKKTD